MNTSELRTLIGTIRSDFASSRITAEEAKAQLQNINWEAVVEDTVPKSSLQAVTNATLMLIDNWKK